MPITSDELVDAAWLAVQSYNDNFTSANNAVGGLGEGWRILSRQELGLEAFLFPKNDYLYSVLTSQGFVAQRGSEVAIVFRGTQTGWDWVANAGLVVPVMNPQYSMFSALVDSYVNLVGRLSGLSKAYVIGHSLGGAMAERFMQGHSSPIYQGITFASAGVPGIVLFDDPRTINVEHDFDPVVAIPGLQSTGISLEINKVGVTLGSFTLHYKETYLESMREIDVSGLLPFRALHKIFMGGAANETLNYSTQTKGIFLLGGAGRDQISGGSGADLISGGSGGDTIFGNDGSDRIDAGDMADYVIGGLGDDTVFGGLGSDTIQGGLHADDLRGGADGDLIQGGSGFDSLYGGTGQDTIYGDADGDYLKGEGDRDTLWGGSGRDTLFGDEDDDFLVGEGGDDTLDGGTGTDTARFSYHSQYYQPNGTNSANFQLKANQFEEGSDQLTNIEWLQFANERVSVTEFLSRFVSTSATRPVVASAPDVVPVKTVVPPPSPAGLPKLYFDAQSFSEGDSGSRFVNLTVKLDKPSTTSVTFLISVTEASGAGAALAGNDFEAIYARSVSIPAGQVSTIVPVRIYGDKRVEGNETFLAGITNVNGAVVGEGGAYDIERITIVNDDSATSTPAPTPSPTPPAGPVYITLRDTVVTEVEGANGTETIYEFSVRRSGDTNVVVKYRLDVDGYGAAPVSGADFIGGALPSYSGSMGKGDTRDNVVIRVKGDANTEPNEYFRAKLIAETAGVIVQNDTAIGVVMNDDGTTPAPPSGSKVFVSIRAVNAELPEGTRVELDPDDGRYYPIGKTEFSFEVTRTGDLSQLTEVNYRAVTGWGGTPQGDSSDLDYLARVLTFQPGESAKTVFISVRTDNRNEPDEPFLVKIDRETSSPNVEFLNDKAWGLILNDDGTNPPMVTAKPILVRETDGNQTALLRVEISHAMPVPVTMGYVIGSLVSTDFPATAENDFSAVNGTITIPPGALFADLPVTIRGDAIAEETEAVVVRLVDLVNGYFIRSLTSLRSGVVVADDDSIMRFPTTSAELASLAVDLGNVVQYSDKVVSSWTDESSPFHVYKITLEETSVISAAGIRPKFLFDANGSLIDANVSGFTSVSSDISGAFLGGLSLPAGAYYIVQESAPGFVGKTDFRLMAIPNSSAPPLLSVRPFPELMIEGTFGGSVAFDLSHAVGSPVTVNFEYRALTASLGSDIRLEKFSVVIPAGERTALIDIRLPEDLEFEGFESFELVVTSVTGAILPNGQSNLAQTIAIADNDVDPLARFSIATAVSDRAEGNGLSSVFTFEVTRPAAHAMQAGSVAWAVAPTGASPVSAADFVGGTLPSGVLSFSAGITRQTISVQVVSDRFAEQDETFRVILSSPSAGFGLGLTSADAVIRNDDGINSSTRLPDGTLEIGTSYTLGTSDHSVLLTGVNPEDLIGNTANNTLAGNNNQNKLFGGAGNDRLFGYGENDTLEGGSGNDTLNGGDGLDTAVYVGRVNTTVSLEVTGPQNTGHGIDVLVDIENLVSSDGNDRLTGNTENNKLIAGVGNDILFGGGGDDSIYGGAGTDILAGGAGVDVMFGEAGNDLFLLASASDHSAGESILGGDGIDELRYYSTVDETLVLSANTKVERVVIGTGSAAAAVTTGKSAINVDGSALSTSTFMIGNHGNNLLIGGMASDSLSGGFGNDTLDGGAGDDTLIGGAGIDVASYATATSNLMLNLSSGPTPTISDYGRDRLSEIEGLEGGSGNDALTGDGLANILLGGAGSDTLNGGSGNDTLNGGAGDDTLNGGAGVDVASYATATAGLTLSLAGGSTLTVAGFGSDSLSGIEGLEGGSGNDTLTGDGLANILLGGAGDDTLNGGLGNDTLIGGSGTDTASYDGAASRVTVNLAVTKAQVTGGAGTDVLSQFENLTGSGFNDVLVGSTGANRIEGGAGNDTITGGAGADDLQGGAGDDLFVIGSFADHAAGEVVFGDTGADELRFTGAVAGTLVLTSGVNVERVVIGTGLGATAVSTATTAINVDGSALTQSVSMIGNAGANRLTGGAQADTLNGGAGNDTLIGGAGDDTLIGGLGRDVLTGGVGTDQFVFNTAPNAATNRDTITDFTSGEDMIYLARAVMSGLGVAGALSADAFRAGAGVITAQGATDRIIHNTTTGAVFYDADGQGVVAAVQILQLTPFAALAVSDVMIF